MFYYILTLQPPTYSLFSSLYISVDLLTELKVIFIVSFYTSEIKSTLNNTYKFISCTKWLYAYEEFKY